MGSGKTEHDNLARLFSKNGMALLGAFLLVALIGYIDSISGYENSMLIFYLLPVAIATWYGGLVCGMATSVLSVAAAITADSFAGLPRVLPWNSATTFVAYGAFAVLLHRLHSLLSEMHRHVAERTAQLQLELTRRQELEKEIALVAEEERSRVGRELHDSVSQHLTGVGLLAQAVVNQLGRPTEDAAPAARRVVSLIDQGIELTRRIARGLYSSELDGEGLLIALELLARSTSYEKVDCEFLHVGEAPRSKVVATHVYWVAREAVVNAVKHGHAKKVKIRLHVSEDHLQLEVEDDGMGLPKTAGETSGIGLKVMAQRARLAGGTLLIQPSSSGTIVSCAIPLVKADEF